MERARRLDDRWEKSTAARLADPEATELSTVRAASRSQGRRKLVVPLYVVVAAALILAVLPWSAMPLVAFIVWWGGLAYVVYLGIRTAVERGVERGLARHSAEHHSHPHVDTSCRDA